MAYNISNIDADILQHIFSDTSVADTEKFNQLNGYLNGTAPIKFYPDEKLTMSGISSDTNLWSSFLQTGDTTTYYQFLTKPHGERTLHGNFEIRASNILRFSARYNNGIIVESLEHYPSGNVRVKNSYQPQTGLFYNEQVYPDDTTSFLNNRPIASRSAANVSDDNKSAEWHFQYIPTAEGTMQSIATEYYELFDGRRHGKAQLYYPDFTGRCLKAKGFYKFGKETGNWYGYYPDGAPKFFQQWNDGTLVNESFWDHSGFLRQRLVDGEEYNYNIPSEIPDEIDVPTVDDTADIDVVSANHILLQMYPDEGMHNRWEDSLTQAIRYGSRQVYLETAPNEAERDRILAVARTYFKDSGFTIESSPLQSEIPGLLLKLRYVITLNIPNVA